MIMDKTSVGASPRRKRARRAAASVNNAVKRLAGKVNLSVLKTIHRLILHFN